MDKVSLNIKHPFPSSSPSLMFCWGPVAHQASPQPSSPEDSYKDIKKQNYFIFLKKLFLLHFSNSKSMNTISQIWVWFWFCANSFWLWFKEKTRSMLYNTTNKNWVYAKKILDQSIGLNIVFRYLWNQEMKKQRSTFTHWSRLELMCIFRFFNLILTKVKKGI